MHLEVVYGTEFATDSGHGLHQYNQTAYHHRFRPDVFLTFVHKRQVMELAIDVSD